MHLPVTQDLLPPHKRIAKIKQQPYDANDLPYGHDDAKWAAAAAIAEFVNELPDSFYHMTAADAELLAERVTSAYRSSLARSLRELWERR